MTTKNPVPVGFSLIIILHTYFLISLFNERGIGLLREMIFSFTSPCPSFALVNPVVVKSSSDIFFLQ